MGAGYAVPELLSRGLVERNEEIVVFDSTGTALQDVAAAAAIYEMAAADPSLPRVALGVL